MDRRSTPSRSMSARAVASGLGLSRRHRDRRRDRPGSPRTSRVGRPVSRLLSQHRHSSPHPLRRDRARIRCRRAFGQLRPDPLACRSGSKHDHVKVPHARNPIRMPSPNGTLKSAPLRYLAGLEAGRCDKYLVTHPTVHDVVLSVISRDAEDCAPPVVAIRE